MAKSHGRPGGPSQRQLRVGEVIRHVLSDIFIRDDVREEGVAGAQLTVSEVRVSPDLRNATVFVSRLGGGEMDLALKGLAKASGFLRHEVGKQLTTKFTPALTFEVDTSFDEASHISEILHSPAVAQDLGPQADPDDEEEADLDRSIEDRDGDGSA